MVESKVILDRKDYIKILKILENLDTDLNCYMTEHNNGIVNASKNKITLIKNLLLEEE